MALLVENIAQALGTSSILSLREIKCLARREKMMIEQLIEYCDKEYLKKASQGSCKNCNHVKGCPGNCENCLYQIHFPRKSSESRKDYDCPHIVDYYVCKYLYAYASEIEDSAGEIFEEIKKLEEIHMLSIGCGASPDLFGIYHWLRGQNVNKKITYIGYEHNGNWKKIHHKINAIFKDENVEIQYYYQDALEIFKKNAVIKANMLVLQYFLSHIVYNDRQSEIEDFFIQLVDNVILRMEDKAYLIIIDINHTLASDYFKVLEDTITARGKKIKVHKLYFPFKELYAFQKDGRPHNSTRIKYKISSELSSRYAVRTECRSVQHIVEVY